MATYLGRRVKDRTTGEILGILENIAFALGGQYIVRSEKDAGMSLVDPSNVDFLSDDEEAALDFECAQCGDGTALRAGEACAYCGGDPE